MWYLLSDGRVGQTLGPSTDVQSRMLFGAYAIGFTAIALEIVLLNVRGLAIARAIALGRARTIADAW